MIRRSATHAPQARAKPPRETTALKGGIMGVGRFSLVLLGPPHVRDNLTGDTVAFPVKGFELAAYLSLEHGFAPARRDTLAQILWEDAGVGQANANLRSLLARIKRVRRNSGVDFVEVSREFVRLSASAAVDIVRLYSLAADASISSILEQCALYRGDLLDGANVGTRGRWANYRAALRGALIGRITRFLEMADPGEDATAIETAAQRLIAIDQFLEAPYLALMRLYAAAGRLRDMECVYRECGERFETELGAAPAPAIAELYRELCGLGSGAMVHRIEQEALAPAADANPPKDAQDVRPQGQLPSICILMPQSSSDRSKSNLVGALLEDATIGLCAQRAFSIIAPYTAWRLGSDGAVGDFVRQYGIDYVLQSRIQRVGSENFLTPKLIDTRSRRIIWADRFNLDEADFNGTYDRLTWRIVRSLSETIERAELERGRRDVDTSSYIAYLRGLRSLAKLQLPDIRAARRLFKVSLKQDEKFALAFSGVARTLILEWLLLARGEAGLLDHAEYYARRALDLDPEQADGLRELGLGNLYRGRFDESLEAFAEAERRAPQHADLIADHADALSLSGLSTQALGKIQRATALNPLSPDRYRWHEGTILYQLEQYEAAIAALSRMSDQSPAYKLLAASWAMLGEQSKAYAFTRKVLGIYPDFSVGKWLSMIPIRDAAVRCRYEQGLRAAGFN